MKHILTFVLILAAGTAVAATDWKQAPAVTLEKTAFYEGKIGPSKPSYYVSFDLSYKPFAQARAQIEKRTGLTLANRGEAHITLVTPPEFEQLVKVMAPAEIRRVMSERVSPFKDATQPVCVGQGVHEAEQTWFVVVSMPSALKARQSLESVFQQRLKEKASVGEPPQFKAGDYNPHVTLGFIGRDLHAHDGVIKNETTCKYPID